MTVTKFMAPTSFKVGGLLLGPMIVLVLALAGVEFLSEILPVVIAFLLFAVGSALMGWIQSLWVGTRDVPTSEIQIDLPTPEPWEGPARTPAPTFTIVDDDEE